jgi:SARP family transcriptional regulator, regulator of embCAB operon
MHGMADGVWDVSTSTFQTTRMPMEAPGARAVEADTEGSLGPRISLLGGFGLSDGRVDIAIAEGPQRLLAFLALRKRPVRRTLAAGALWPDVTQEHASSSLRSTLARLDEGARSALAVTASQLGIADQISVDLWESEALARRLAGPHESLTVDRSSSDEVDALSSDILPDWYEDWVIVEAETWRQRRLHALETLADDLRGEGSFGQAALAARAAINADPLRESPRAALVRVHMAEGNVSDALREFSRYRELLERELGLQPTPRLQALLDEGP